MGTTNRGNTGGGAANVSAATGTLPVANGGTGVTAITASRALVSNADSTIIAATTTATSLNALAGSTAAGDFTPTVSLAGAGNVPTYATNTGRYVRVGNRIFTDVYLNGNAATAGSGATQLRVNLPVTASASSPAGYFHVGHGRDATFPSSGNFHVLGQVGPSATYVELAIFSAATTTALFTGADQATANRSIRLNFSYEA